ncbi:MAG: B12-binding domain-containing radical SAM protein [Candidatus Helarchaeota archaeon]
MTNILLIRPKIRIPIAQSNPPLGLGYLAAVLRKHGHQVNLLDCAIIKESYKQIRSRVKKINPDIVGITALSSYYNEMRRLARILQPLNIPIILGGVHVSALPKRSLYECKADFVVIGEGEYTLLELLNKWSDENARKEIKGIAYIDDGRFIQTPKRKLISNLDEIPFPAWDLINPLKYPLQPHGAIAKRSVVAPILTTRGCPFACTYCASTHFWGHKFRRRSAPNIVDEIELLVDKFRVREIHIWDDNFTLIRKHVVEFCREVLRRKLDLTFACPNGVRIDTLSKELLTLMRRTGFYSLTFAIESGSQTILNNVNKKLNLKIIPTTIKVAKKLGFIIPSFFIFGLPGETYETARRTIQFAKSLPIDLPSFFIAKPLPGSQLFEDWIRENQFQKIDYNWFYFHDPGNNLIINSGNRTLNLPKDAYREFLFRPKQLIRTLKIMQYYPKKELIQRLLNLFNYI